MTSEITSPVVLRRTPLYWLLFMPWRWGRWGWPVMSAITLVWFLLYLVSFPVVHRWLNSGTFQYSAALEAVEMFYWPLDQGIEHSEMLWKLFCWEDDLIRQSPALSWMLPQPEWIDIDSYMVNPEAFNSDGSPVVMPENSLE
jgi:hypothetical protein